MFETSTSAHAHSPKPPPKKPLTLRAKFFRVTGFLLGLIALAALLYVLYGLFYGIWYIVGAWASIVGSFLTADDHLTFLSDKANGFDLGVLFGTTVVAARAAIELGKLYFLGLPAYWDERKE